MDGKTLKLLPCNILDTGCLAGFWILCDSTKLNRTPTPHPSPRSMHWRTSGTLASRNGNRCTVLIGGRYGRSWRYRPVCDSPYRMPVLSRLAKGQRSAFYPLNCEPLCGRNNRPRLLPLPTATAAALPGSGSTGRRKGSAALLPSKLRATVWSQ